MDNNHTCWNCKNDTHLEEYCHNCLKILPLVEEVDYFSYLGLKKQLNLDLDDLEKKFYEMSRKYHPDYYSIGQQAEKEISVERSSFLNSAYKVLKDPIERARYLLKLEWGEIPKDEKKVPQEILLEIIELQEKIEEEKAEQNETKKENLKKSSKIIKDGLKIKNDLLTKELEGLFEKWDMISLNESNIANKEKILKEINKNLSIRAYLDTLISTFEN